MSAYEIAILSPQGRSNDGAIDKFIDSFQLIDRTSVASQTASAAQPPAQPAKFPKPDSDPLGPGGFIGPPSNFPVTVCLAGSLVASWDNHATGSKMDSFKDFAAIYIKSNGMPDWEYWISEQQYNRYQPGTSSDGSNFISAVSPDSGRFDPINPTCPAGYATYHLPVSR